jgi:hypothetical protein
MRRKLFITGTFLTVLGMGLYILLVPSAGAVSGKVADHSLFDGTGGETGVRCRTTNGRPFIIHVAVRAIDGDATMRVLFRDGSQVDYPVANNQSFSLDEAAGTTPGVDTAVRVKMVAGLGKLVGWVSASRAPGTRSLVFCQTLTT